MRIVLDTNIVVSALAFDGQPLVLMQRVLIDPVHILLVSPALLAEYESVLTRSRFKLKQSRIAQERSILDRFPKAWIPNYMHEFPPDPADGVVLGVALIGHADLLVTGDRALLDLGRLDTCDIVTVADALLRLDLPATPPG